MNSSMQRFRQQAGATITDPRLKIAIENATGKYRSNPISLGTELTHCQNIRKAYLGKLIRQI